MSSISIKLSFKRTKVTEREFFSIIWQSFGWLTCVITYWLYICTTKSSLGALNVFLSVTFLGIVGKKCKGNEKSKDPATIFKDF